MAGPGTTRYAVLAMLALGPKSGYDIQRALKLSVAHFWSESNGQLYPALRALVAAGLVRPRGRRAARARRGYAITPAGEAALRDWLSSAAPLPPTRNELLLKIFVGWFDPPATLAAIESFRARLQEQRQVLDAIADALGAEREASRDVAFWLATVRSGRLVVAARLDWCDEALRALGGVGQPAPSIQAVRRRSAAMAAIFHRVENRLAPRGSRPRAARRRP